MSLDVLLFCFLRAGVSEETQPVSTGGRWAWACRVGRPRGTLAHTCPEANTSFLPSFSLSCSRSFLLLLLLVYIFLPSPPSPAPSSLPSPSFLPPSPQGSFRKCSPARESAIVSSVSDLPGGGGRPNSCQQEILPESPMRFSLSGSDVEWARCRDSVCWRVRRMSGKMGRCAGSESQHSPMRVCGRRLLGGRGG